MKVTIEITNTAELEQLITLIKSLNIEHFKIIDSSVQSQPIISKGDKSINPKELFGIWKDNPRNLAEIRDQSWNRNWNS